MKNLLYLLLFLIVFGVSFYFFLQNSAQNVELVLWADLKTPPLPVGLVVLIAFFSGFLVGLIFFPLTYIIKRLTS
ncbi:MAG: hypothetical protein Q9N34_04645 [Aquificota bacterium]|nr:hypothetical protein [Aquificota bacterium]